MLIKLVDIKNFTKLNSYEEDGFTSILINRLIKVLFSNYFINRRKV